MTNRKKKPSAKPAPRRTVTLDEADWEWLTGWLGALLKQVKVSEMTNDSLTMGRILRELNAATVTLLNTRSKDE